MDEFSVKLSGLKVAASESKMIETTLAHAATRIGNVQRGLRMNMSASSRVKASLEAVRNELSEQAETVKGLRMALEDIEKLYAQTEFCFFYVGGIGDWWSPIYAPLIGGTIDSGPSYSALLSPSPQIAAILAGYSAKELKDETNIKIKLWEDKENESKIGVYYDSQKKKWVQKEYDEDEDDEIKLRPEDVTLYSVTAKKEVSAWHGEVSGQTDWSNYKGSMDIFKGEAWASGKLTAGYMGGTIGFGLSAFDASAEGQLGNDILGIHGKTEVEVGKIEGKVEGRVGWVDEDGNFDPSAKIGVEAEALLASVSGTVGLDVLGTDIDVEGKVGVGLGFKAETGYADGKLSLELGGYIGIGGDVSLEIDVSGTVDAIVEFASNVESAAEAAGEFIGDVAEAGADFLEEAGDALEWLCFWR